MERPGEVCTVCPTCVSSRNVFEGVGSRVERGGLMDKAGVGAKVWLKETAVPAWCHKENIYIYLKNKLIYTCSLLSSLGHVFYILINIKR